MPSIQVVEYASPVELLQNDESAFSKMVQSTGAANAQYLRRLALGEGDNKLETEEARRLDGQRRWLASSRWAAAAQFALAVSLTSSHDDLIQLELEGDDNILRKTKDAVITLQGVLEGKHDKVIEETLDQYQVPSDRWWSSLYKMVEGMICMNDWMYNVLAYKPTLHTYLPGWSFFRICFLGFVSQRTLKKLMVSEKKFGEVFGKEPSSRKKNIISVFIFQN